MKAILVHGGCDELPVLPADKVRRREGVLRATHAGARALADGAGALDAVEAALRVLEDDPIFDAGTGSFYNLEGEIEMDALLADSQGRAGGVAAIQHVRNPVEVARQVMERTPHILLVGEGATRFARAVGIPEHDPVSDEARRVYERAMADLPRNLADLVPRYRALRDGLKSTSTVGAVAVDDTGLVVAGTSTGGIPQKLPGRVGDSAMLGAGTFAGPAGGSSATGMGEGIIRLGATRALHERVAAGEEPQAAAEGLIARFDAIRNPCGVIFLDGRGRTACAHNGWFMPVALRRVEAEGDADAVWLDVEPTEAEGAAYLRGGEGTAGR